MYGSSNQRTPAIYEHLLCPEGVHSWQELLYILGISSWPLWVSPTEAGGTTVYPGASRVIPVHGPGCTGWKWRFFAEKISTVDRRGPQDPGAPRPVHPGRAPAGPRFIPALTRFTPVLGPVLHGSPRSMPAEPRWHYGSSRFSTVELRSFPVQNGSSRRGENAV